MQHTEGTFSGADGAEVYFQYWQPAAPPRAVILVAHGAGEHGSRYAALASYFTARGYVVAVADHPGHGKSAGSYGHIRRLDDLLASMASLDAKLREKFPQLPVFLLGHSMGGLLACLYLLEHQQAFRGCVLSGAAVKTEIEPPAWQLFVIRCLSLVAPRSGALRLDPDGVSRDPNVVAKYEADPLINHGKMSARMVAELFSGMRSLQARAGDITLPILILHGGADSMTSPEGSRFLFEHVGSVDKGLEIFPGLYHEIFNEPERDALFADMFEWFESRLEPTADRAIQRPAQGGAPL